MKAAKMKKSGVIDLRMLKPQTRGKGKGIAKGEVPAIRPPGMPARSFWAFNMFMRDFRKTDEFESMIMKAGNDKWLSMTESERGFYEEKLEERTRLFEQCLQDYEKLKENVDEGETQEHGEKEG